MTLEQLAGVRALAESLPPGTPLPLPRELVLELLGGVPTVVGIRETPPADHTIAELAERYGRNASTVRAWVEAGRFPGAYRLLKREWRIPPAAIAAFEEAERNGAGRAAKGATKRAGKVADLGAWRTAS